MSGIGMAARFLPHAVVSAVVSTCVRPSSGWTRAIWSASTPSLHPLVSERGQTIGINLSALSCIDLALWDIMGKAQNRTVAQLLGGHGPMPRPMSPSASAPTTATSWSRSPACCIDEGHRGFKMLVGVAKGGIHEDAARVRHVRDALGDDVRWPSTPTKASPLDHALRLAHDRGVRHRLVRGPGRAQRPQATSPHLRRSHTIPLSAGQMDGHSGRFRAWIEHDAIDIFMPNSLYNGGMTETRRVAALAQIYDRPLSDAGGGGIFCLHHVAGFRNGTLAECHLGVEQVEAPAFPIRPAVEDGRLRCPTRPASASR
jgi:L-rhamnonate dehydratase